MKVVNFITHPVFLLFSFCFIIISGEDMAGFYIMYLYFGLIQTAEIHCIIGLAGIILLVPGILIAQRKQASSIYLLNIIGAMCMMLSLLLFFFNDEQRYNINTFYQFIPFCTIILFCLLALIFLAGNIKTLLRPGLIKK